MHNIVSSLSLVFCDLLNSGSSTTFTKPANSKVLSVVRQTHTPTFLVAQACNGYYTCIVFSVSINICFCFLLTYHDPLDSTEYSLKCILAEVSVDTLSEHTKKHKFKVIPKRWEFEVNRCVGMMV